MFLMRIKWSSHSKAAIKLLKLVFKMLWSRVSINEIRRPRLSRRSNCTHHWTVMITPHHLCSYVLTKLLSWGLLKAAHTYLALLAVSQNIAVFVVHKQLAHVCVRPRIDWSDFKMHSFQPRCRSGSAKFSAAGAWQPRPVVHHNRSCKLDYLCHKWFINLLSINWIEQTCTAKELLIHMSSTEHGT